MNTLECCTLCSAASCNIYIYLFIYIVCHQNGFFSLFFSLFLFSVVGFYFPEKYGLYKIAPHFNMLQSTRRVFVGIDSFRLPSIRTKAMDTEHEKKTALPECSFSLTYYFQFKMQNKLNGIKEYTQRITMTNSVSNAIIKSKVCKSVCMSKRDRQTQNDTQTHSIQICMCIKGGTRG